MRRICLAIMFAGVALEFAACGPNKAMQTWAVEATGGNPQHAPAVFEKYGCVACHTIDGIRSSDALVGPPLTRMAGRSYLAGMLPNSADNLIFWIRKPHDVNPKTAMPDVGVTEQDARDMASYLYSYR